VSNRIKELRKARGLTQTQLAILAGTTLSQMTKLELGLRSLNQRWALRLAPHLGVQPHEIFMPAGSTRTAEAMPDFSPVATIVGRLLLLDGMKPERADALAQSAAEAFTLFAALPNEGEARTRALLAAEAAWRTRTTSKG
jgi:transcriptional regulator with XRE-family HTH domain